jgi:flavin-dependent dehydrogenase
LNDNAHIDVVIVGGGLAGLTAAIHLSKKGIAVLVIEKNNYPKHKVCGEYVSNEVLPYLQSLAIDPFRHGAKKISRFLLSTPNSKSIETQLPLGGFGISRYTLDYLLWQKARASGAQCVQDTVTDIQFVNNTFEIKTKNKQYQSKMAIGAYGKRSNLDSTLHRDFITKKSPFLAVKTHLKGDFPGDLVALHNFKGGYCGLSKTENDIINACYITHYKAFKPYKNIQNFQEKVLCKNRFLKEVFENSIAVFDKPLTISQVSFYTKKPVEQHILMCGDSAGMIHPLAGNGMSMAIRSGRLVSQLLIGYFSEKKATRATLEKKYKQQWNTAFKRRLKTGHIIASLFEMEYISEIMLMALKGFPSVLPKIIEQTHGKPLIIK